MQNSRSVAENKTQHVIVVEDDFQPEPFENFAPVPENLERDMLKPHRPNSRNGGKNKTPTC